MTIAIIGAGLAGLAAARRLVLAGEAPVLFEKSRGIGGRVATRRGEHGALDHGAPLLHGLPRDVVAAAGTQTAGWRDGVVGVPGNSSLPRALAAGLDLRGGVRVTGLERSDGNWRLRLEDGDTAGGFAAVLVAIPQPQAVALLCDSAGAFDGLDAVRMRPGLTLLAWFEAGGGPARPAGTATGAGTATATGADDQGDWRTLAPPLGLAVREAAKPGRMAGPLDAWAIHAADAVAEARLEDDPAVVAQDLLKAFREQTGAGPAVHAAGHRWRYARTARPLGRACLWDDAAGLGLAGDWCLGAVAGDAVASGRALADAVLARAGRPGGGR